MAITVGSVEVDVIPNTQGIYQRLRAGIVPAATRAGEDAGSAAGRAFGPAMQGQVNSVGLRIGEEIGQQIASRITASLRDAIRSGVTTGGQTARPAATRQGDETGGAFSRALKARLEAAFRSLPRADIRIGDAGFDADMARLRARIETLSGKRIGIDVSAEAAKAEITAIEERLRRLGAEHPNVQVRADTAAALAQLAAVRAQIDGVDGDTAHARVDIDTSGAMSAIFQLTVALAGVAAIPAIPVLGAGLGALASSAVAAGAGVGALAAVAIPAISGIRAALTAQTAAQQAASTANASAGQSSSQAASKALQLAGAQQSLATAERNGANQIAQAQQQVKQARQGVSDAITQAAQRTQQAERQVQDAERALTQAQKDATQAQLDLTAARKQAVRDLQDMNNNLADAQLSQRDAMLQVQEAKTSLDATLANPKATELQRQQAQLQYDQAVQHLKEQQLQTKRLQSDTAAANKAGVNGSASVKTAQDKVAAAQQTVADRTRALRDAQVNQAQVATQNARAIADAQQKVATAEKNVATAQQNAADSIASAQRQIQQAQLSTASTASKAETAQSKYQAALAKLTPAARGTFDAFLALRAAFKSWSESLQPQVMPLFTRALVSLRNTLPTLTLFVKGAVDAIKELQDRVSASVKSPFWQGFKKDLQGSVKPAIVGLGVAFGNVITGMAGIIDAFLPHMDGISGGLQRITGKFADWGTSLKGSPAFERFLQYAAQEAPKLGAALGQIATAFLAVGTAIAPLSGPALAIITALASGIAALATTMPGLVQLMYATYVATRLVTIAQFAYNTALGVYRAGVVLATLLTEGWAAAIVAANLAFDANPIVVVVGIIVAVLAALVLAVIYAWNHFTWFRDAVKAVWTAIQIAALWAWQNVLQPVFNAIWGALKSVGDKAVWLWQNVLVPAFSAIALAARILITAILVILILPWVLAFKLVATVATWLWAHAIKPAFDAIGAAAGWLWRNAISPSLHGIADLAHWLYNTAIRPVGSVIQTALHAVGNAGTWLWKNAISPAVHGISDAAHWLYDKAIKPVFGAISTVIDGTWRNGIKPVFDLLKTAVGKVADSFETARKTIKTAWDKLEDIAKKPVNFIIDVVYNKGIVGVWNKIAGAFGAPTLKTFQFATGGIMPGYTPGRDVHQFVSPTGGALELSGGEAIMRPEFTRAVGSGFVGAMNSIAKSRGEQGVKAALAPVFGGNPSTPTDRSLKYADGGLVQRFGDGGIFGWISSAASAVKGVGSAAWNGIKKGASWLADTLEASARAGVKHVVDPLLSQFPGMDTGFGKMIRHIPTHMIDALFGYSKESDKKGGGGLGGPKIQSALNWAKTQAGLPYQWAGNGNPSWDCLTLSSMITTPQGHTELRDLYPGMQVLAYQDGKLVASKVLAKWNTGEQALFKVRTRNRSLRATGGHRVLVAAPKKRPMADTDERVSMARWGTEWKHVRDLTPSDYLVTYTGSPKEGGEEVPEDLAWLMGLWLADGSVHTNGGIRICVYNELAEKAMAVLREHAPDRKVSHHPRHGVMVSDIQRARWMIRNGFTGKSHERTVPSIVTSWSESAQTAFLKGYADGDGSYKNGGAFETAELIEYKATSRELIEGIREMHIRRGDRVSVTNTRARTKDIFIGGKKIENARPIHSIEVAPGKGATQTTGAGHRPGLLRLVAQLNTEGMSVQRVLSVEPDGVEETWDIEVEDSHSFVSDGLISHNCSGFMSAIESVIRGQKPHRRWATGAFSGETAPPGWVLHGNSPFRIGITNAGVGHTAGTLGKTNVESRGGAGVIVGSRARGYKDSLFTDWYGFQPGKYDSGGYLQPGLNLAYNGTGRPEPVFTSAQAKALTSMAAHGASGPASFEGDLYLDSGEFLGKVRGEAQQVMQQGQRDLMSVINAS